ncbi:MAG: altronate dehydratase [Akkermansiaceae bacterium]|nr:altronate dehydratase [Akkermansiaceae bacterium]MCP5551175.1 altronate dehydratase [Akkermansiaceae bacterium]
MNAALTLDPRDNLAVALRDLDPGEKIPLSADGDPVETAERIPAKQKVALRDFAAGDIATLYGVTVGKAVRPIARGGLITTENLAHLAGAYSVENRPAFRWDAPEVSAWTTRNFDGFHRADGSVGTGNYWIVAPLVFCENRNLLMMREALDEALGYAKSTHYQAYARRLAALERSGAGREAILSAALDDPEGAARPEDRLFPRLDGVKFLLHGLGCGGTKDDARALCGLLAGYITHPNVAGATVLSLGCQNAQIAILQEEIAARAPKHDRPVLFFEQQKWPSEQRMLEAALRETFAGLADANTARRRPAPLSKLLLGVECGGSDGFSGISANPTIGRVSDLLVALGGAVILSEFPELCGVEQELVNRCATDATAARYAALMRAYSNAAEAAGSGFDQNPSPGNIRDGLITDAIKSAGAAKKGGTSPVTAALDYPEKVTRPGLNLLCTPGGDVESTTAMAGSGANLMFFSTGLGTPTGNPVVPVVKIATNTEMATRLSDIIDFDTGAIIRGEATVEQLGDQLLDLAIEVASGRRQTKAQHLGQDDFLPWKRGVSL